MKHGITKKNEAILEYFKEAVLNSLAIDDFKVGFRRRDYKMARWLYYRLCSEFSTATVSAIGESLGQDHATVLHALKNFRHEVKYEEYIGAAYEKLKATYLANSHKQIELKDVDEKINELQLLLDTLFEKRNLIIEERGLALENFAKLQAKHEQPSIIQA